MLKLLSSVIICLTLTNSLRAQDDFYFGLKGGVNFSQLRGASMETDGVRIGSHVGIVAHFDLSEKFSLQPEITYSTQGYRINTATGINDNGTTAVYKLNERFDYINIPVLVGFEFARNWTFQMGPQLGISIGNSVDLEIIEGQNDFQLFSLGSLLNTIEFGLGSGFQFDINSFFIQARYIFGLSEVIGLGAANGLFNSNGQVSVGYKF